MHACIHTCIHAHMHTCIHAYMHLLTCSGEDILFGVEGMWVVAPTRHGAHNWEGVGGMLCFLFFCFYLIFI